MTLKMILVPVLFALGTALCWGSYGPTLSNSRSPTGEWSPFKPYVFIGIAYLVLAVGGGLIGMYAKGDSYSFSGTQSASMNWGFLAGCLGALGALCLTTAMLTGGKPAYVMPIVFGGAVTVNAIIAYVQLHGKTQVSPILWVGMALVVLGVVIVAANTPHGPPPKKAPEAVDSSAETSPANSHAE